jgi:hypothetical protein
MAIIIIYSYESIRKLSFVKNMKLLYFELFSGYIFSFMSWGLDGTACIFFTEILKLLNYQILRILNNPIPLS